MIPDDAPHGMAIRWIGETYSDELGEHGVIHAEVRPGDLGTFIDFDRPPVHPNLAPSPHNWHAERLHKSVQTVGLNRGWTCHSPGCAVPIGDERQVACRFRGERAASLLACRRL